MNIFETYASIFGEEALQKIAAEAYDELEKEAKERPEGAGPSQVGTGVRIGAEAGAGLGAFMGAITPDLALKAMPGAEELFENLRSPKVRGGLAAMTAASGVLGGSIAGGIQGKLMDVTENKLVTRGSKYDPMIAGPAIGAVGGAVGGNPASMVTGAGVGALIAHAVKKSREEQVEELAKAASESKEMGPSQIGTGARIGAEFGAGMGVASQILANPIYDAYGKLIYKMYKDPEMARIITGSSKEMLASMSPARKLGLIGTSVGTGAFLGGMHGALMDSAEEKAIAKGKEYNPIKSGIAAGTVGGAVTQLGIGAIPGAGVGALIGNAVNKERSKEASEVFALYKEAFGEEALQKLAEEAYNELEKEAGDRETERLVDGVGNGILAGDIAGLAKILYDYEGLRSAIKHGGTPELTRLGPLGTALAGMGAGATIGGLGAVAVNKIKKEDEPEEEYMVTAAEVFDLYKLAFGDDAFENLVKEVTAEI